VRFSGLGEIAQEVQIRIEVPRGSFVKRRPDGSVDFVSPLPCPYNYGSIEGTIAADGDPLDALLLGHQRAAGTRVRVPVRAVMGFVDDGIPDPKVVCSVRPLTRAERRGVERFFRRYAVLKRVVNRLRRRPGRTLCIGWLGQEDRAPGEP
jgi:inorganic pyrophosphatase